MRKRQPQPPLPSTDVRILEIGAEHIRRHGLARMTITQIAHEAMMSHANIYRYYPSKEALIDEITSAWLKPIEAGLRVIADAPDPAFDKLERILFALHRAYRGKRDEDPNLFDLLVAANAEDTGIARRHRHRCQLEIQRVLEEGVGSGTFTIADFTKALALVLDTMHRFIDPAMVKADAKLPHREAENRAQQIVGLILRALASGRL
jgi:AcrR family transcriptional regulator